MIKNKLQNTVFTASKGETSHVKYHLVQKYIIDYVLLLNYVDFSKYILPFSKINHRIRFLGLRMSD